jgi:hypothetical protein
MYLRTRLLAAATCLQADAAAVATQHKREDHAEETHPREDHTAETNHAAVRSAGTLMLLLIYEKMGRNRPSK